MGDGLTKLREWTTMAKCQHGLIQVYETRQRAYSEMVVTSLGKKIHKKGE